MCLRLGETISLTNKGDKIVDLQIGDVSGPDLDLAENSRRELKTFGESERMAPMQ